MGRSEAASPEDGQEQSQCYRPDTGSHFALLLIGQPTLRRRLKLAILAALDQRISTRYAITCMNLRPSPQIRRPLRHPVLRRRYRRSPPIFLRLPTSSEQPRRRRPDRNLRRRQNHRRPLRNAIRHHREQRITAATDNDNHVTTTMNAPPKPMAGRFHVRRHRHHP